MDYGDIAVQSYGKVNFNQQTGKTTMDLTVRYDMPIDKSVMDIAIEKIKLEEGATAIELLSTSIFDAFAAWSDVKFAQKSKESYLEKSELKKIPSELDKSIVITGVKLTSFESKKNQDRGLVSFGENAGVISVYGEPINKSIPVKMSFSQAYSENVSGDKFGLYLNAAISKDYYFEYAMVKKDGEMKIFSEDEDFAKIAEETKGESVKLFVDAVNRAIPEHHAGPVSGFPGRLPRRRSARSRVQWDSPGQTAPRAPAAYGVAIAHAPPRWRAVPQSARPAAP
jgi:hypothetical protein